MHAINCKFEIKEKESKNIVQVQKLNKIYECEITFIKTERNCWSLLFSLLLLDNKTKTVTAIINNMKHK